MLYVTSSSAQSVTLAITECEFEGCSAQEMSLTVSGCSFVRCNVSESGGSSIGVYCIVFILNS